MTELNGKDYISVGELVERHDDGRITVVATPGETCERVNPRSLGWLLEQHAIVPVEPRGDVVPPMLTPGEVVLNADQQRRVADALQNGATPDEEA